MEKDMNEFGVMREEYKKIKDKVAAIDALIDSMEINNEDMS
jgi:hypothetical protein